ncbi:MAG: beta-galactosidase [Clostridia bacterium]|nr:beta-galactosidase [Clostridia bacterium]
MQQSNNAVKLTKHGILLGDHYEVLLCGSLFYFRLPRAVWKDRIEKLKRAGYNCVDVYFPWNYHEKADGSFDFEGERDVKYFLEELKNAGIYVIARPGPYICSEWNGGALPARILESGMPIRCNDKAFLKEVAKWYRAILTEIAPYTYSNGGSVILLQIENELDFFDCPDPEAYIAELVKIAHPYVSDIPYFCCAGQFDVTRAGGLTNGVEATMNCYPDSLDPAFDKELQGYAFRFMEREKPLLVSETNRDHFLLRRELSCGSKLLGAYNQVAGNNFDYNQAVNNWGSPDAILATQYDFWSMIDVTGNYRPEAEEAVLFSAFLKVAGQALAGALPESPSVLPDSCTFTATEGGLRVLALQGGGAAVCVPNYSKEKGTIEFTYKGRTVKADVLPQRAPFFLFDFDLAAHGIPARLTRANCEPVYVGKDEIVFFAESTPEIGLDFGDGEKLFTKDGTINGISVRFADRREALSLLTNGNPPVCKEYESDKLVNFFACSLPAWIPQPAGENTHFGALGISEGAVEYVLQATEGKELFVEHPCDLMRVTADGKRGDTYFADGRDVILPASGNGHYEVVVEKWGHSNFDDSQSPAIRAACKKGALSFGIVKKTEKVQRCDFHLLNEYGAKKIKLEKTFPVRLSVDKWNSTRKPVICAYSLQATRTADRLIIKATEQIDIAVYLNGNLLGECDFGTFELTPYLKEGQTGTVTLVYRKHLWTQNAGELKLLHIDTLKPVSIRALTGSAMCTISGKGNALSLPLKVEKEEGIYTKIAVERESIVRFSGKNVKLTCVMDGRVIGRLVIDWEHAPALHGGEHKELYICPAWSGDLYIYAEPLGADAELSGAEILSVR